VLSSGDDLIYFVQNLNFAVLTTHPVLDRRTSGLHRADEIFRTIRRYGARYLLESRSWYGPYMSPVAGRLAPLLYAHPEAIAFAGVSSFVVDLKKLDENVSASCFDASRPAPGEPAVFAYDTRFPSGL
jgi:hypothetical protein